MDAGLNTPKPLTCFPNPPRRRPSSPAVDWVQWAKLRRLFPPFILFPNLANHFDDQAATTTRTIRDGRNGPSVLATRKPEEQSQPGGKTDLFAPSRLADGSAVEGKNGIVFLLRQPGF